MRFHTQTAGVSLTAQQPLVNIVRTTIEALAGVLGGTQSLHTNSYDEALALPTEEAVRVALRTQQVIAHESGVTNTVDPLGGSYFVEKLTDEMEAAAYEYFARIDELGGMVEAIKHRLPPARDRRRRLHATSGRSTRGSGSSSASTTTALEDEEPIRDPCAPIPTLSSASRTRLERDQAEPRPGPVEAALAELQARPHGEREPDAALHRRAPARARPRARWSRRCRRSSAPTPSTRSSRPGCFSGGFTRVPIAPWRSRSMTQRGRRLGRRPRGRGLALSNHPTREEADRGRTRSAPRRTASTTRGDAAVDRRHRARAQARATTRQGIKPAFLAMAGLLVVVTILLVVAAP